MNHADAFQILKARYCIAVLLIDWYWQPGRQVLLDALAGSEWYVPDLVFHYYSHALLALFLIIAFWAVRLEKKHLFRRDLVRDDLLSIIFTVIFTYCASLVIVTVLFVPLSYLLPSFVTWWLSWFAQPVVYLTSEGSFPIAANVLSFLSLVIIAPVLEELIFRGYLLHRWSKKWGLAAGILLSSAVFGAVHPDTLAAAITGIGFALLYLKTQTLWAPIAAHSLYNLIVWLWEFYGVVKEGLDYYTYTIDQFRDDWWYGAIAFVIVILMVDRVLRRDTPLGPFVLPPFRE